MKKFLYTLALIANLAYSQDAEIVADAPAEQREAQAKFDATKSLHNVVEQVSKAQTTTQQVMALKNLQSLQNNPGASIQQVNSAVSSLVSNFNTLNSSHVQNLSQLIDTVGGSTSSMGMNIKLMQASNMQLSIMQNSLQTMEAQNDALIAYKQAEANEQQRTQNEQQQRIKNNAKALSGL